MGKESTEGNMGRYRHECMELDSVTAFVRERHGADPGGETVCFVRVLGASPELIRELSEGYQHLEEGRRKNELNYKRIKSLSVLPAPAQMAYYVQAYDKWIACHKKTLEIHATGKDPLFADALGRAMEEVCDAFTKVKGSVSESMRKNFVVKLAVWTDFVFDGQFMWRQGACCKVIGENAGKEQEYLFYELLALMGVEVLLLQTKADVVPPLLKGMSREICAGDFADWELPEIVAQAETTAQAETEPQQALPAQDTPAQMPRLVIPPRNRKKTAPAPAGNPASPKLPRTEKTFEQLAQLASSVVMIGVHDASGEAHASGSGIMVGRGGYILTNYHVVRDGRYFSVRIEDDDKVYHTDEIIKYNYVHDMAILRIDRTLAPLPVYDGAQKLVRGQKVVAIGSPMGLFNSVSDGIIAGFRTINDAEMIQFTAPISRGSSGGAVVNMYGEVIGISTAGIDSGQNLNLAVPYDCIAQFCRGFR